MSVHRIKLENHKKRCVMKFLFLQEKRAKAISGELSGVFGEAAVRLGPVKRECRRFKNRNLSLGDEFEGRRLRRDIGQVTSQFLRKETFISGCILAKRLATNQHVIKKIRTRNLFSTPAFSAFYPIRPSPSFLKSRLIHCFLTPAFLHA
jgi:hypothetical protein